MKSSRLQLAFAIAAVSAFVVNPRTLAQHYPAGSEGIKAATLPPPGVYLRDYNLFYFADQVNDASGHQAPVNFDLTAYAQAIRPIWITDWKLLGGNYGMDVLVPFLYQNLSVNGAGDSSFNLGDVFVEPITLSWHGKQYDASVGYGFWAPTGTYDLNAMVNPGQNFWTQMFTAGGTVYFDEERTWALSALSRYEFNSENPDTDVTPGQTFTLEWAVSKTFEKTIDVGIVGYFQQQTTHDSGPGADSNLNNVGSIGPEVNIFFPSVKLFTSLRYEYEFFADDRPQGQTVTLTLTKIL